jgi:transposase
MFPRVDRACGIDVHRLILTATIIDSIGNAITKEFSTRISSLLELREWIIKEHCERVLMEATGIYWHPIYAILEEDVPTFVANPYFIKYSPSSKTDKKDSVWLAEVCLEGHFRASYVPEREIREYRDLCREYRNLVQERTKFRNKVHRILSRAGIRLSPVISDIFGKNGLIIIEGLLQKKSNDQIFDSIKHPKILGKKSEIINSICGDLSEHDIFLIESAMRIIEVIDEEIDAFITKMELRFYQKPTDISILISIPGIQLQSASAILAEIGDISQFPSSKNLVSYAGLDPKVSESAGKAKYGHISKRGNKHLRFILVECANALSRSKNNHLKVFYERLKKSKGHRQAVVATARKLLVIIYHLLTNEEIYEDDLMLKPKKVKMPSHKKKYSPADKITFDDKISEKIQDVIDKTIRTLNPMKITQ